MTEGSNKKADTLTVSFSSKSATKLRIAVRVVNLDYIATSVGTLTIAAGGATGSLSFSLGSLKGTQYEMLWTASTDPASSDLVLVVRQIA